MAPLYSTEDLKRAIDECYKTAYDYGYQCGWNDAIKSVLNMLKGGKALEKEDRHSDDCDDPFRDPVSGPRDILRERLQQAERCLKQF